MNSWAALDIPTLSPRFSFPQLRLFDTASQSVGALKKKELYRIYVCGITPYDATHLGHAATYLTFDLINRYLRASGAQVRFVQNITDIDDPLLERAERDGLSWQELAESQIELFRGDMVNLRIIPPTHYIGVVEAMPLIVSAISKLQEAGTTYRVEEDLYFLTRSDKNFGSRSHLTEEQMLKIFSERGGDPDRVGKEDPLDALLWRSERGGEPAWPAPFGSGRPGWHVECSAIALHYLSPISEADESREGESSIDIQGGGSDLIFPHHEMSAAQGELIGGRPFAEHFVHSGMIGLAGEKMSKSLGNLVFVSKLIGAGVDPTAIRWALMANHYAADRMWTDELLESSQQAIERLRSALSRMEIAPIRGVIESIIEALANDLDTPKALSIINSWIEETEGLDQKLDQSTESSDIGSSGEAGELSRALDSLLGLAL